MTLSSRKDYAKCYCVPNVSTVSSNSSVNRDSLGAQLVKNPPAMQKILVGFLGGENQLKKGSDTQSSILGLP